MKLNGPIAHLDMEEVKLISFEDPTREPLSIHVQFLHDPTVKGVIPLQDTAHFWELRHAIKAKFPNAAICLADQLILRTTPDVDAKPLGELPKKRLWQLPMFDAKSKEPVTIHVGLPKKYVPTVTEKKSLQNPDDWPQFLAALPEPKTWRQRRFPAQIGLMRWKSVHRRSIYADIWKLWFSNFSDPSGTRHVIAAVSAPNGAGKTHLASVLAFFRQPLVTNFSESTFRSRDPNAVEGLRDLKQSVRGRKKAQVAEFVTKLETAFSVAISFGYMTEVCGEENFETELDQMIASRLVYSFFCRGTSPQDWSQFRAFLRDTGYYAALTTEVALKMIRADVNMRGEDGILIVVVDELMRLTHEHWSMKRKHEQLDAVLACLNLAYKSKNTFLLLTSSNQEILNTKFHHSIRRFRLPTLSHAGIWELIFQKTEIPAELLDSEVFMALLHESGGISQIVNRVIEYFPWYSDYKLPYLRDKVWEENFVGRCSDVDKRKEAVKIAMNLNPSRFWSKAEALVDEGYLYHLPLMNNNAFGVPPLFMMKWENDGKTSRVEMPLLQAVSGFIDHARYNLTDRQHLKWQLAYLFLVRFWTVLDEERAPTLWDLLRMEPPENARKFCLVRPTQFQEPLKLKDFFSDTQFERDSTQLLIAPRALKKAGYDIVWPVRTYNGLIRLVVDDSILSNSQTVRKIGLKFGEAFYDTSIDDEDEKIRMKREPEKQRKRYNPNNPKPRIAKTPKSKKPTDIVKKEDRIRGELKLTLFNLFAKGEVLFIYAGGDLDTKEVIAECTKVWKKIKHRRQTELQAEGQEEQLLPPQLNSAGDEMDDETLVRTSVVNMTEDHARRLLAPSLQYVSPLIRRPKLGAPAQPPPEAPATVFPRPVTRKSLELARRTPPPSNKPTKKVSAEVKEERIERRLILQRGFGIARAFSSCPERRRPLLTGQLVPLNTTPATPTALTVKSFRFLKHLL